MYYFNVLLLAKQSAIVQSKIGGETWSFQENLNDGNHKNLRINVQGEYSSNKLTSKGDF